MTEPDPIFTCDDTPQIMPADVTIADLDLANKAATAVQYLRLCPEAGPERIAALETVLIAADRFAQIMPKIVLSIKH